MKQSKTLKLLLALSGFVGVVVGVGMLFFPIAFHASSGIKLDGNINLLNEMRASGGVLLVGAGFIMAGAFSRKLTLASTIVATVIYLSYGSSRLMSMLLDGKPDTSLIQVAGFEMFVGLLCAAALFFYREETSSRN